MRLSIAKFALLACISGLLTACGGGGGGGGGNNDDPVEVTIDPPIDTSNVQACPGSSSTPPAEAPVIPPRSYDWDCNGIPASVQTPSPGVWSHVKQISGQVVCIRDTVDDQGDVVIEGSDIVYISDNAFFPGDVIFLGNRVQWEGGSIGGQYVCNGCSDVVIRVAAVAGGQACLL